MSALQSTGPDASTEDRTAEIWQSNITNPTSADNSHDDEAQLYSDVPPNPVSAGNSVDGHNSSSQLVSKEHPDPVSSTVSQVPGPASSVEPPFPTQVYMSQPLDQTNSVTMSQPVTGQSPAYHLQFHQNLLSQQSQQSQEQMSSQDFHQQHLQLQSQLSQRSGSRSGNDPSSMSKIFVGGLSWETDEDSLRNYFETIGKVLDCVIMRDRHTGHPRGFGFVTFADEAAAVDAASRRHDLDGRHVEAKRAVPRNEGGGMAGGGGALPSVGTQPTSSGTTFGRPPQSSRHGVDSGAPSGPNAGGGPNNTAGATTGHRGYHSTKCKVFVGGLPSSCGGEEFRAYFSQFGEVTDAQVMIDHNTGNSRGFGFVTFANEDIVSAVVGPGKSNTDHEIMGKCVEVKRAEPKGPPGERRNSYRYDNANVSGSAAAGGMGSGVGGGSSGGPRGHLTGNNAGLGGPVGSNGSVSTAAAAAAYYSNYPPSLAEQYGAYYNNPQWQQYFTAMGYNFNAYPQGFGPYQQYLQAYMSNANASGGAAAAVSGSGMSGSVDPGSVNSGPGLGAVPGGVNGNPLADGSSGKFKI